MLISVIIGYGLLRLVMLVQQWHDIFFFNHYSSLGAMLTRGVVLNSHLLSTNMMWGSHWTSSWDSYISIWMLNDSRISDSLGCSQMLNHGIWLLLDVWILLLTWNICISTRALAENLSFDSFWTGHGAAVQNSWGIAILDMVGHSDRLFLSISTRAHRMSMTN